MSEKTDETAWIDPITAASFRQIDQEIGPHPWQGIPYEIVRRAIHATADFELRDRFVFSPTAVEAGLAALRQKRPVVVDVRMVAAGIQSGLQAQGIPLYCALDWVEEPLEAGQTRTAQGMIKVARRHPEAIFVVGNAPTALLALVERDSGAAGSAQPGDWGAGGLCGSRRGKTSLGPDRGSPDSGGGP
jgi:precorrin-8X/cobalt-precorrin-8 methylmutase